MRLKQLSCWIIASALNIASASASFASDHIDGPRVSGDAAKDIADLFAFPSPEKPGQLVLIMNVNLFAKATTAFSDALNYTFILRRAKIVSDPQNPEEVGFATNEEVRITCRAGKAQGSDQSQQVIQKMRCEGAGQQPLNAVLNSKKESTGTSDVARLYVGRRSDPSFLDIPMLDQLFTLKETIPTEVNGTNTLQNDNILSIIVELDTQRLLPNASLLAVAAELTSRTGTEEIYDRMGRAEITNTFLARQANAGKHDHDTLKDIYNSDATFAVSSENLERYRDRLFASLFFFDRLDGQLDWRLLPGRMPIVNMLLQDHLVVDTSKSCGKPSHNYLEIERAVLKGVPYTTCGGRRPNDDVISVINTIMVEGLRMDPDKLIVVGTDTPTKWAKSQWPYLVEPN